MKRKSRWIICVLLLVFIYLGSRYIICVPQKDMENLSVIQKWLINQQVPYDIVTNLSEDLLKDMKEKMENSDYELGEVINPSGSKKNEVQFNILYKEDKERIDSYYIRNVEKDLFRTEDVIKCSWDIKELTLESFNCIYYVNKDGRFEISSTRPLHAGLGYYEVEVPEIDSIICESTVILISSFLATNKHIASLESIHYDYK